MRNRLLWGAGLILVGALCWYLWIRPADIRASFQVDALPGVVYQSVKTWSKTIDNSEVTLGDDLTSFTQTLEVNNSSYVYQWRAELVNDSTSQVIVSVIEPTQTLLNRVMIPFTNTKIEADVEGTLKEFYKGILDHLTRFKVEVVGVEEFAAKQCVYIPLQTTQTAKAIGMMQHYSMLSSFVVENGLKTTGMPIVEVTNWDQHTEQLEYNFCYPIELTDSLPDHPLLKYKSINATKAVKAIYNGNYISSDRAWYALKQYAKKNNLKVSDKPIEVFFNNPNIDSNELSWTAEIYLPLVID
ncbi:MAG: GyrI-like domain-containing protein [Cyclobacteriaceae bacterium]